VSPKTDDPERQSNQPVDQPVSAACQQKTADSKAADVIKVLKIFTDISPPMSPKRGRVDAYPVPVRPVLSPGHVSYMLYDG
jgi:hypothetical protein